MKVKFCLGVVEWREGAPKEKYFMFDLAPFDEKCPPLLKQLQNNIFLTHFHIDAQHRLMAHAVQHSHI